MSPSREPRIGSLCSGYGGLDLAVEAVFGASTVWQAETDEHCSTILAERFGVPNLGDLTAVEFPPCDILTAGFPCQPVSLAGARKGTQDERWLWDDIAAAVGRMDTRPGWVVLENVRGLLTADGGDAMGRVVHRLARLGYVGRYGLVRASDAGAPHRRERVFIVAHARGGEGWPEPLTVRGSGDPVGPGLHRPATTDACGCGCGRESHVCAGIGESHGQDVGRSEGDDRSWPCSEPPSTAWGAYGDAIRRWEALTRPAPVPTDDRGRLNPRFVEWMMGLPAGWVTDLGLPRTAELRALGNGVVPQQAALALRLLLGQSTESTHTHTHTLPADAAGQRQQRDRDARERGTGLEDRCLPTPTAWLGSRESHGVGDAERWANPSRSRELSDFIAHLGNQE